MIACTENCKFQKNGECTYEEIMGVTYSLNSNSNCAYFEEMCVK